MRLFELTEFEWFHYWPFDVLIAVVDQVVASQDVDFEPEDSSDVLVAIEEIADFVDTAC